MKILLHEITYNFLGEFVSQLFSLLFVGIKITSFHENSSFLDTSRRRIYSQN